MGNLRAEVKVSKMSLHHKTQYMLVYLRRSNKIDNGHSYMLTLNLIKFQIFPVCCLQKLLFSAFDNDVRSCLFSPFYSNLMSSELVVSFSPKKFELEPCNLFKSRFFLTPSFVLVYKKVVQNLILRKQSVRLKAKHVSKRF